ncbi:hypothetical protein [Pseudoneobacillus sp. C159]
MFDIILTMSALLIIGSTILPIVLSTMSASVSEKETFTASVLLYEKLNELLAEKKQPEFQIVKKRGKTYEFLYIQATNQVCIQFDDPNQIQKRVCEYWE